MRYTYSNHFEELESISQKFICPHFQPSSYIYKDLILQIYLQELEVWLRVPTLWDPEFKPQYCQKKKKYIYIYTRIIYVYIYNTYMYVNTHTHIWAYTSYFADIQQKSPPREN
jgi:hypothetical protein